jgi:4-hydroxybenzoate polyprenyltransferase
MFINFFYISRPYQWIKNCLIFLPLIVTHQFELIKFLNLIPLFISVCLVASAVYCYNDIKDLEDDRKHPEKKNRPLASKKISIKETYFFILFLLTCCYLLSIFFYELDILIILTSYVLLNIFYSNYLKKIIFLDILILSLFYMSRIYIGSLVYDTELTIYFLVFTFSSFIALASIKRLAENVKNLNSNSIYKNYKNFPYTLSLLSIMISLFTFVLYTYSGYASIFYKSIYYLYFAEIIIFLWFLRILKLTKDGKIDYDPVKFVIKDKITWLVVFLVFIVLLTNSNII